MTLEEQYARVSPGSLRSLLYPGATTKVGALVMLWHGDKSHQLAPYRSDDPDVIRLQVAELKRRQVDFAILCTQGPDVTTISWNAALGWMLECERRGLDFCLMLDEASIKFAPKKIADPTAEIIRILGLCSYFFFSPRYLRHQGRFAFFEFGWENQKVDYRAVRDAFPGIFLFARNGNGFTRGDGVYAWPGSQGFKVTQALYPLATSHYAPFMAAVFKGFDASQAAWGKDKPIVAENHGQTWLDSFAEINRHWSESKQLGYLLVETWNDYAEGTDTELGIAHDCQIAVTGNRNVISMRMVEYGPWFQR